RRARRRRGQETLHDLDVRGVRPGGLPAPALRIRPTRAGQPGEGDADAAAVRRGARSLPAAPAGGGRGGGALLRMAATPLTPEDLAGELGSAAAQGLRVRIRGAGTKLHWGAPADADLEIATTGL